MHGSCACTFVSAFADFLQPCAVWCCVVLQLVPAVTELIIAEMLYLQHKDRFKPLYLYINSTGGQAGFKGGVEAANIIRQAGFGAGIATGRL